MKLPEYDRPLEGQTINKTNGKTIIYKTLHRKLKIEQQEFEDTKGTDNTMDKRTTIIYKTYI